MDEATKKRVDEMMPGLRLDEWLNGQRSTVNGRRPADDR
jgi:hypothetical protein